MRSSRNKIMQSLAVFCFSAAVVVLLSACLPIGPRPPSATVNKGADPFHADQDVLFRTTYYFRVFDYCVSRDLKKRRFEEDVFTPLTDSLYRFRMTGKGRSSWFSNIQFESGTLMAWEVDPFGAKVEFDPDLNRARVIPPREIEADAKFADQKRQINEMMKIYERLPDDGKTHTKEWKNKLSHAISSNIDLFAKPNSGQNYDSVPVLIKIEIKNLVDKDAGDFAVQVFEKNSSSILDETKIESPNFLVDVMRKTIIKAISTNQINHKKLTATLITLRDKKNAKVKSLTASWDNILPNLIKPAIKNLVDNDIDDIVVRVFEENNSSILDRTAVGSPNFVVNVARKTIDKAISTNQANHEKLTKIRATLDNEESEVVKGLTARWGELEQKHETRTNYMLPNLIRENLADSDIGDIVVSVLEENHSPILNGLDHTKSNFLVAVMRKTIKEAISTNQANHEKLTAIRATLDDEESEVVKGLTARWGELEQEYETLTNYMLPNLIRENLANSDIGDIVVSVLEENNSPILNGLDRTESNFLVAVMQKTIKEAISTNQANREKLTKLTVESKESKTVKLKEEYSEKLMQSWDKFKPVVGQPGSIHCPDDAPARRGFQVLGPEGWRTFNHDERLMLAMSAGTKQPLISTLKELSNRVINSHENAAAELPLIVLEQKRISDMLDDSPSNNVKDFATEICNKLVEDMKDKKGVCDE